MKSLPLLLALMMVTGNLLAERVLTPFSARYQLVLDDQLVGHVYAELKLEPDNTYQFEMFTVPAGVAARDNRAQEVYEVSKGRFDLGVPTPDSYYYSSGKGQMMRTLQYTFDWENRQLIISNQQESTTTALAANAQDRISYLLLSTQLTEPQEPAQVTFPLLGLQQQKITELTRGKKAMINVPAGNYPATEIKRRDNNEEYSRHLWFSDNEPRLPVLIEVQNSTGLIRMELLKVD